MYVCVVIYLYVYVCKSVPARLTILLRRIVISLSTKTFQGAKQDVNVTSQACLEG